MKNEIKIETLTYGGNGLGRQEGKVVFVPLTAPGDRVEFNPIKEKKGYIEAELTKIVEPSPIRREPPCPLFGECGGCSWQHLPYGEQMKAKEEIFRETLWRLGTVEKENILPIIPAPMELNYRNRAQFKVRFTEGKLSAGFYRRHSHALIDMDSCPLMSPLINSIFAALKGGLAAAPFRDKLSQIDISVDDSDRRGFVIFHLITDPTKADKQFARETVSSMEGLEGLFFRCDKKPALTKIFIKNNEFLDYSLVVNGKKLKLAFSPGGFTQVNYAQNRRLVEEAVKIAGKGDVGKALDLYCGIGNFSLPLAELSKEVTAIEGNKKTIEDGKGNAKNAGSANCRFIAGDALKQIHTINLEDIDLALIDPPREGAAKVMKKLAAAGVAKIIYISCNPTTLARDLRYLTRSGYTVVSSQPIDLFPQTWHIESITVAQKGR
ncbi:MAG: 23S rRNA (uracil(1939)-C(5))-methyltransferase RlmD [bacterium]|nr:23S rRNA (uracil(1939)-C(5))-methyltransferase RlmD [bacterium]